MGEKKWLQPLGAQLDRLRIHFITKGGRVASIIVIQYEAYIDGQWQAIVRYDEAHGFFHRDMMSPTGGEEKTPLLATDRNLALTEAIMDIKQNWPAYRKMYEEKYYGQK
jgi:hypothetical protein